ncbi:MAG: hypothetical protein JXD22_04575 [Sedimentisphaerales bacterium]|nr:hypothetical protein [Sedimentisphaerales bacterium]
MQMYITAMVKIKMALVLAVGGVVFGTVGWALVRPEQPGGAFTVVMGGKAAGVLLSMAALGVVVCLAGSVIGTVHGRYIGQMAIPAGLTVWAIRTGSMDSLLLSHSSVASRASMFHGLMFEVLIWLGVVLLGCWLSERVFGLLLQGGGDGVGDNKIVEVSGEVSIAKKGKDSDGGWLDGGLNSKWLSRVLAVLISCIIGFVLMKLLARSGVPHFNAAETIRVGNVPATKQIVFAVGAAFFLGTLAAHQLFRVKLWYYLLAPAIVAWVGYAWAGYLVSLSPLEGISPHFVHASVVFATVLPVQFLGIGSLATIVGFWYSTQMHHQQG